MLRWPLRHNEIRKNSISNTFGMVRNGGTRAHQGWDFRALPWTDCFAVADGIIKHAGPPMGDFGEIVILEFNYRAKTWYAAYAHLNYSFVEQNEEVRAGQLIAQTGNTGNASNMSGEDQHLHFEIRTIARPGLGLSGRVDPILVYGICPLKSPIFESRIFTARSPITGKGLKSKGLNVL